MNFWDELAKRCYLSRDYLKTTFYLICYGEETDPWLKHIILRETANVQRIMNGLPMLGV